MNPHFPHPYSFPVFCEASLHSHYRPDSSGRDHSWELVCSELELPASLSSQLRTQHLVLNERVLSQVPSRLWRCRRWWLSGRSSVAQLLGSLFLNIALKASLASSSCYLQCPQARSALVVGFCFCFFPNDLSPYLCGPSGTGNNKIKPRKHFKSR